METVVVDSAEKMAEVAAKTQGNAKTKPELKPLTEREKAGLFLIEKQSKSVPIIGTDDFFGVRFPASGCYFLGIKESGAKVSVNLNRSGVVTQYGVSKEGKGIFSQPPFKLATLIHSKRFVIDSLKNNEVAFDPEKLTSDQWKLVWFEYLKRVAKLGTCEVSDSKHTAEYRNAYLTAITQDEVSQLTTEANKADGNVSDLALAMIENNNATKGELQAKNRVIRETMKKLGKEQAQRNAGKKAETAPKVDEAAKTTAQAATAQAIAQTATAKK